MNSELLKNVLEKLPCAQERESLDHPAIQVPAAELYGCCEILRDELGFDMLMDVTAIDWGQEASPRFTGIYHLFSLGRHEYLRVAADCPDDNEPALPSLVALWPGADWLERETYDMFGISYTGHPDLRRILMWDGYPYFPLRKEFPLAGIETDLPADDVAEVTQAKVIPAPMMGGPFHAPQAGAMSQREPRAADQSWTEKKEKSGQAPL